MSDILLKGLLKMEDIILHVLNLLLRIVTCSHMLSPSARPIAMKLNEGVGGLEDGIKIQEDLEKFIISHFRITMVFVCRQQFAYCLHVDVKQV